MRALWNGALGFGLVNIPIKIYSASLESTLDLDLLDSKDFSNIKFKRVNESSGKEVPWEKIVKGYKLEDKYIVLEPEDFEAASPEKSKIIAIKQFVNEKEIDSAYFETPYFLEPQKNGHEAYSLLLHALLKSNRAGIGTFILREKEILGLVRVYEKKILMLHRLRFPQEIRSFEDLKLPSVKTPKKEELTMAQSLIDQLATDFDPTMYKDTYSEDLLKIIKQKAKGKKPKTLKEQKPQSAPSDLMAQLKASLQAGKKSAG